MKILLAVLSTLLVSLLLSSQAESFDEPSLTRPASLPYPLPKLRECYYEPENRTLVSGKSFTPKGRCMVATCVEDDFFLRSLCRVVTVRCENPTIEEGDLTKTFPDCCLKAHCD